ncbi:hypothetical protein GGX14DRAFT_387421 [Mycena pura]|uniref:Uncharacterized protein n=1 Tax=Mycena pura TaxID=153505 RepID=A0AAD6YLG4_9AGAR|nr:hypothetical protein GGX14DRAFT_387421 [Mycena pura]
MPKQSPMLFSRLFSRLLKRSSLSRPFTDGPNFFAELFEAPETPRFRVREDNKEAGPVRTEVTAASIQAAETLKTSDQWCLMRRHLVVVNEAGPWTLIDLIMLAAIRLAQKEITQSKELDNKLAQRHCPPGCPQWQHWLMAGKQVRSWIALQLEVTIPTQQLSSTLSTHGIIDYGDWQSPPNRCIVSEVQQEMALSPLCLKPAGTTMPLSLPHSTAAVSEVKSFETFKAARLQVLVQGTAVAMIKQRPTINILTDAAQWEFYVIEKIKDTLHPTKPFKAMVTRTFNVGVLEKDLAIVLRLLPLAILHEPHDFLRLAQEGC